MIGVAVSISMAGLLVAFGLSRVSDALRDIAKTLDTINTHGLHLRNYPRETFKIEGDQ